MGMFSRNGVVYCFSRETYRLLVGGSGRASFSFRTFRQTARQTELHEASSHLARVKSKVTIGCDSLTSYMSDRHQLRGGKTPCIAMMNVKTRYGCILLCGRFPPAMPPASGFIMLPAEAE